MPHTTTRIEDGVAWIRMDDGQVNAMSTALMGEIDAALREAEAAAAIPILIGREGIFSAGFDLRSFARGREAGVEMVLAGAALIRRFLAFPLPIVTACTGHAYPMGAFLMLAADARFGVAGPWRIGMNEVAIQMTVPRFALELARHRLTPAGLARVTTGAMLDPEEARRAGYLDFVVAADELEAAAEAEARRLATLDLPSHAETKARIHAPLVAAIDAAVASELAGLRALEPAQGAAG